MCSKLLHTEAFTHRSFLHAEAFAHRSFYTQELLHRRFYTQTLLHTEALTHTETFTHRSFLHADAFAHRTFYTQKLFTRRRFCTQKLLHTGAFTHRRFYTQTLLHTDFFYTQEYHFTAVFGDQTSFRAKGLRRTRENHMRKGCDWTHENHNFTTVFGEPHFVRKGCADFTTVFGDRTSFHAKGLRRTRANRIFTTIFGDRTSFRAKWLRRTRANRNITSSFRRSNLISREMVAPDPCKSQYYQQFLAIEPRFVRKGSVSCRLVGTAPRLKREMDKKERARGQERM